MSKNVEFKHCSLSFIYVQQYTTFFSQRLGRGEQNWENNMAQIAWIPTHDQPPMFSFLGSCSRKQQGRWHVYVILCCFPLLLLRTCLFSGVDQHGTVAYWWLSCYLGPSEKVSLTVIFSENCSERNNKALSGQMALYINKQSLIFVEHGCLSRCIKSNKQKESPLNSDVLCEGDSSNVCWTTKYETCFCNLI